MCISWKSLMMYPWHCRMELGEVVRSHCATEGCGNNYVVHLQPQWPMHRIGCWRMWAQPTLVMWKEVCGALEATSDLCRRLDAGWQRKCNAPWPMHLHNSSRSDDQDVLEVFSHSLGWDVPQTRWKCELLTEVILTLFLSQSSIMDGSFFLFHKLYS